MTDAQKKEIYDRAYQEKLQDCIYDRYVHHRRLDLKARRELEELVSKIVALFKANNISVFDRGYDVHDILIKMDKDGSDVLNNVNISTHESCWSMLMFQRTEEEKIADAERYAEQEVERKAWKEEEEAARKKAEEERLKQQQAAMEAEKEYQRQKSVVKLEEERILGNLNMSHCRHKFVEGIDDIDLKSYDEKKYKAVDAYILQCNRFSDAMNAGLTGMGLYTFNNDRTAAHEEMLEAFNVPDSPLARNVTKNFNYCDDYDIASRKYKAIDHDESARMLIYALEEVVKFIQSGKGCQPKSELYHTLKGVIFSLLRPGLLLSISSAIEALNSMSVTSRCSVGTDLFTRHRQRFICHAEAWHLSHSVYCNYSRIGSNQRLA